MNTDEGLRPGHSQLEEMEGGRSHEGACEGAASVMGGKPGQCGQCVGSQGRSRRELSVRLMLLIGQGR